MNDLSEPTWEKVAPLVDEAMGILGANDRDAVVLRYFQGKTFAEVAPALTVANFDRMAGEWEGTFKMRGNDLVRPIRQTAALPIRTGPQGRSCHIEMRVLNAPGGVFQNHSFSHSLSDAGDRIITLDDPGIARPLGEGVVTRSVDNQTTGEWRVAFHAQAPNGGGSTDCEWICERGELKIVRREITSGPRGESEMISELRLRRSSSSAAAL